MGTSSKLASRILKAVSGDQKVVALLREAGYPTIKSAAGSIGEWPATVSKNIHGHEYNLEIRAKLAKLVGLSREELDSIIGGVEPVAKGGDQPLSHTA